MCSNLLTSDKCFTQYLWASPKIYSIFQCSLMRRKRMPFKKWEIFCIFCSFVIWDVYNFLIISGFPALISKERYNKKKNQDLLPWKLITIFNWIYIEKVAERAQMRATLNFQEGSLKEVPFSNLNGILTF